MRDDDASRHTSDPLPLAVMVQPDPMLEERPAGPLRLIAAGLGAALIVTLALYGMSRPAGEPQVAEAPQSQPTAQSPTTTGQGAGEPAGQPDTANQAKNQPKGQTGPSKTPPAAGHSATGASGARPAPEVK